MIHMFASDYDGTLFKDHVVTQHDLDAIHKFRSLGHKFGIVTGRSIDSIRIEIDKYNIPVDFLVGINGGVVLDHDYKELYTSKMDSDLAKDVMDHIEDFGVHFYGANDGYRISRKILTDMEDSFKPNLQPTPIEEIMEKGIAAMYIWSGEEERAKELAKSINDKFGAHGIHSFPNTQAVDVGIANVSKSTGIEIIRDHYNYAGQIFTVGDSFNDVPMIKDFHGFLMENGSMEIQPMAKGGLTKSVGDALLNVINSL